MLQAGVVGCDAGDAPLTVGPLLRLESYEPVDGQGLDCDATEDGCGFPGNKPIQFRFDRWLLPSAVNRQSFQVGSVGAVGFAFSLPRYDLLRRSVTYRLDGDWGRGVVNDMRLYDSGEADASWGFRAYDGQPLDRTTVPEHILFRVASTVGLPIDAPAKKSCRDALSAFASAGCAASNCHHVAQGCRGDRCRHWPSAGLELDSADGLSGAIHRIARSTDRGPTSGEVTVSPERFGLNMPLIEPREPSLSLLMMRMLLGRDAYRDSDGHFVVKPPSVEEIERARSWFGVIGEMPPAEVGWPEGTSPFDIVSTLQQWVWGGADTSECE